MRSALLVVLGFLMTACGNGPTPVKSNAATPTNDKPDSMIAHGPSSAATPVATPASANTAKTKWTQSGDPIDTTEADAAVAKANKDLKAKPADESAKKAASEAYFNRASALTEARQYASALGDYRKAYKLDPSNADAKGWIDRILQIYDGLNKTYPAEGEEPPPLPFKKEK